MIIDVRFELMNSRYKPNIKYKFILNYNNYYHTT